MDIFCPVNEELYVRLPTAQTFQIKVLRCQAAWQEAAASLTPAHLAELNLARRGRGPHGGRHGAAGPADHVQRRVIVLRRLQSHLCYPNALSLDPGAQSDTGIPGMQPQFGKGDACVLLLLLVHL